MILSVFADEINREEPLRALQLARDWGSTHVEIRSLPGGRFPRVSDGDLDEHRRQIGDLGLAVSGVSPGFFKCSVDDASVAAGLAEELPRACDWAMRLGTDRISSFACRREGSGEPPSAVIDLVARMADIAVSHGCRLTLENESVCWGNTGAEAYAIIRAVGTERLSLCWDPGNSARAGDLSPFAGEYQEVKDQVSHVHMKNFDPATGNWELLDTGAVDWREGLAALAGDGYAGFVVIETHRQDSDIADETGTGLTELERNTQRNFELVRAFLAAGETD